MLFLLQPPRDLFKCIKPLHYEATAVLKNVAEEIFIVTTIQEILVLQFLDVTKFVDLAVWSLPWWLGLRPKHYVGPPFCWLTARRWCFRHLMLALGAQSIIALKALERRCWCSSPYLTTLALGTWKVTSLVGRSLS